MSFLAVTVHDHSDMGLTAAHNIFKDEGFHGFPEKIVNFVPGVNRDRDFVISRCFSL